MTKKTKTIFEFSIITTMAIMLIIGFLFNLASLNPLYGKSDTINGYNFISYEIANIKKINGIIQQKSYIYDNSMEILNIVLGIIGIVLMLTCFIATTICVLSLIYLWTSKDDNERQNKVKKVIKVLSLITASVYTVLGIVFAARLSKAYDYSYYISTYKTSSFALLIIEIILVVGVSIVGSLETNETKDDTNDKYKNLNENKKVELIKKYHELLSSGAITQEEFDKKKNEILGE